MNDAARCRSACQQRQHTGSDSIYRRAERYKYYDEPHGALTPIEALGVGILVQQTELKLRRRSSSSGEAQRPDGEAQGQQHD